VHTRLGSFLPPGGPPPAGAARGGGGGGATETPRPSGRGTGSPFDGVGREEGAWGSEIERGLLDSNGED
jgi:hypothetical protein